MDTKINTDNVSVPARKSARNRNMRLGDYDRISVCRYKSILGERTNLWSLSWAEMTEKVNSLLVGGGNISDPEDITIDLCDTGGWDECCPSLSVAFTGMETDEEAAARVIRNHDDAVARKKAAKDAEDRERAELKRLKDKYGEV